MKKSLLIALALPAMFAACSQEEIINEAAQQGELLGKVAGDINFILEEGVDSRLSWNATDKPAWDSEDEFSLFWVGATGENKAQTTNYYKSTTNALYQRADENSPFESQNVVYVGKHIIVYPADKAHYTDKEIIVSVGAEQKADVDLGLRSIYTSDLLTIEEPVAAEDREEDVMYAGYNEPVVASVAALSTNMALNLNFGLTSNMQSVTIKKVELEAYTENSGTITPADVFAADGYLKLDNNSHMSVAAKTLCSTMTLVMPANTVITQAKSSYTAQISLLPQTVTTGTKFAIKVYTNYGLVTIDKAKLVTNNSGKYQIEAGTNYNATVAEGITDATDLSFMAEFNDAAERGADESSYGFRFVRNVVVDMSTASIANWPVANSTELVDAYAIYDLLGKTAAENFVLVGEKANTNSTNETFELTPAALAKIKANNKVTLQIANTDTLELSGEFTAVPELTEIYTTTSGDESHSDVILALGEGTEWTLDVMNAKIFNSWKEISVEGELTINQSSATATGEQALAKNINNLGNVTFSGNVTMPVVYTQLAGANTDIDAESYVTLNAENNALSGTVNVQGKLVNNKVTTLNTDASLTVAGSLMNVTGNTLTNLGTVTLEGTGSAIVSNNGDATNYGSIVLANRKSQVNVAGNYQGYIKWNCDVTEFEDATDDAFNYLILNSDVKFKKNNYGEQTDKVKYIEVAGDKVTINGSEGITLTTVTVNAGKTMVVPVGFTISTTNTVKNGDIEVYGEYKGGIETGNGHIFYL